MNRLYWIAVFAFFCEATKTVLTFSRKINTCDDQDRPLQNATSKIIWSYNDNDPLDPNTILYHQKRGVTSVRFLNPSSTEPDLPSDAQSIDIRQPNSTITFGNGVHGPTTQYWCTSHKINFTEKQQVVRVEPIIDPRYIQQIHHLVLYRCESVLDEAAMDYEGGCYDRVNMPGAVYQCNGDKMVHVWAVGGASYDYPVDVGLPMGPGVSYFVLQAHIENPTLVPMTDTSGFRLYTTTTLREFDAGVGLIGLTVDRRLTIPPLQPNYRYPAICPSACTQSMYGSVGGIKILGAALHTHVAGRKIYWHHYRDNQELTPIVEEPYYDFNYQDYSIFDPPLEVKPGDEMLLECYYDTTGRTTPTNMGLSTEEEMCVTYMIYYPAVEYDSCWYSNLTDQGGISGAVCGAAFSNVSLQPYTPYVPPPCEYTAPDPARMTPVLKNVGINPSDYERSQFLDSEQKYKLYWTVDKTNFTLRAAVEVETTGWVGLGISTNGMEGADVLIGWIKDGEVFFADRFATAKAQPPVDALQDYYDISGAEVTPTTAESKSWVEGLSRPAIAGFFAGVGAVLVLIGVFIYSRYRKRQQKNEYYGLEEETTKTTKESILLDENT